VFKWRRIIVLAVCLAFLVLVISLYFRQHSMLYHPRPYDASYADALPHDGAELHFATIAGKQVAFYLRAESSEGYATIATTRAAADNALDALAAHLGVNEGEIESRLGVMGHSFGTAVALDFATRHPVGHIILISVFTTLREEAATIVGGPLSYLLIENYDNRATLRELARRSPLPRIDIFHGTNDDTIPIRMGRELAEDFPALVKFHAVAGGDHVSVIGKATDEIVAAMNE